MAVRYQTEDCSFRYTGRRRTTAWIRRVAEDRGYSTGEIAVVFCSDAALLQINREYLAHDYLTDIITFDYTDPDRKVISGDLMISVYTVRANAVRFGVSFAEELSRVIVHGILHLTGQGDKRPAEAKQMRALEDKYLAIKDF